MTLNHTFVSPAWHYVAPFPIWHGIPQRLHQKKKWEIFNKNPISRQFVSFSVNTQWFLPVLPYHSWHASRIKRAATDWLELMNFIRVLNITQVSCFTGTASRECTIGQQFRHLSSLQTIYCWKFLSLFVLGLGQQLQSQAASRVQLAVALEPCSCERSPFSLFMFSLR